MSSRAPIASWRRDLAARRIAPAYAERDGLAAVLLYGGVARRLEDGWSDLDLGLVWRGEIPSEEARRAIAERLGGASLSQGRDEDADPALRSASDAYYLGGDRHAGLKIDLTHKRLDATERLIADVVEGLDVHRTKLAVLHSLGWAEALQGAPLLAGWRARFEPPPLALLTALAEAQRPLPAIWTLEMTAAREDVLLFQEQALSLVQRLLVILLAANGRYPPLRFKHLRAELAKLELRPRDPEPRIRGLLRGMPSEAIPAAEGLVDGVLEIATARLPGFDAHAAGSEFRYRRARLEDGPTGVRSPSAASNADHETRVDEDGGSA